MSKTTNRALYSSSFKEFIDSDSNAIFGELSKQQHGNQNTETRDSWEDEIEIMKEAIRPWQDEKAEIILEYSIPRLQKRIDVVLLLRGIVFCIEFKVNKSDVLNIDLDQVLNYALDLKNFHEESHNLTIVPILVPTETNKTSNVFLTSVYNDKIYNPIISNRYNLQQTIREVLERENAKEGITVENWLISNYSPTPTIVEAARALYENHSVKDITRCDAANMDETISYIREVIRATKEKREKTICFLTGVPGAGKTLVGLDIAVNQAYESEEKSTERDYAVYLSGNGPLVAVLREALARNHKQKIVKEGNTKQLSEAKREIKQFIQNIHSYRDNMLAKLKLPVINGKLEIDPEKAIKKDEQGYAEIEHIAIFDEAQRAWTHKRIANYLKRGGTYGNKMKVADFPMSESAFLIWSMDQREDWGVIICLVGGGQEINTGEAGISEWIYAINEHFSHWNIHISNQLTAKEYAEGRVNELLAQHNKTTFSEKLHLAVSNRSFRAEELSKLIHSILSFEPNASDIYQRVRGNGYPVVITRDIEKARKWLREQTRGSEQTGMLITKTAARLTPLAVAALGSDEMDTVHWFLEDKYDVRSSNYLEEAATEIQVQGLELDYACVIWDADMRYTPDGWSFWKFNRNSSKWIPEKNEENQKYMVNAYRVLLTRARQGIVVCIPEGNINKNADGSPEDSTRLPEYYNNTYNYLKSLGIEEL